MLLNMTLKRAVDFHGRLCPDLVIGGKLCEYVQEFISENGKLVGGHYGDEDFYNELEPKVMHDQVAPEDVVQFQKLLDRRVRKILAIPLKRFLKLRALKSGNIPLKRQVCTFHVTNAVIRS